MRVLVTGGAGFVGRHFARALLDAGHEVTVVDDLSTGLPLMDWPHSLQPTKRQSRKLQFVVADLRDFTAANPNPSYDSVFHLAAVVGGRLVIEGNPLLVGTDLAIDAALFNWCVGKRAKIGTVVYFSSSAAYPVSLQERDTAIPLSESLIRPDSQTFGRPDLSYGWAKLTGEYLAMLARERHGLRVVIYRPFSGYGEDQDASYPFPRLIRRVCNGEDPLVIWGSGEQLRDFIHIDDVVAAVMTTFLTLESGTAVNLGSGVGTSFRDLATLASAAAGYSPEVVNDATKPEGVFSRVADASFMRGLYTPTISLADGVARAVSTLHRKSRVFELH